MTRTLFVADRVRTPGGQAGDSVLVEHGVIVSVGIGREMEQPGTAVVRFPGCEIVPGFRDAHLHPVGLAATRTGLDLSGVTDFGDLTRRVRRWAARLPPHAAVVGTGLDDERMSERRMPNRHDLDGMVSDRPIIVYRRCSHIASVNTAALELAGLDHSTPDPPGGSLDRATGGIPTGILMETAIELVTGPLAPDAPAPDPGRLAASINALTGVGITSVDAIVSTGSPMWCGSGDELELLLEAGSRLIPDVAVYVIADTPIELREAAAAIAGAGLEFGGWKGFADGSLGGHTALLRQPYSDRPGTRGLDRWAPSTMRTMAATALELGGNVAIHAIGDAAVERAVGLAGDLEAEDGRFRIEHASVVDRPLIERMAGYGIVASVQPSFIPSDAPFLHRRLGPERTPHAYPLRSMIEAGVTVIAGSDAPIETPDPLAGMAAAMHRPGLGDGEALDREAALAIHSAHSGRPGDPADLAVIRGNLDGGARVAATIVRGEVVQERRRGATSDS